MLTRSPAAILAGAQGAAALKFIGAVDDQWQMFSDDPADYELGPPIGFGATSVVHAARYTPKSSAANTSSPSTSSASSTPTPLPCAVKVVDLDKLPPQALRLLRRETQLMSLSKHPNVLRVRGSWVDGHKLFIALRLMNAGSAADIMRYAWPAGMEEEVVKCILRQALEGLNYLHINGFIHRDVKAANLLLDDDGTVLLGDLGVSASLCDEEPVPLPSGSGPRTIFDANATAGGGSHQRSSSGAVPSAKKLGKRKSFVGTPCWMAPELISGKQYDAKADIWSFGITAIELTQGRAPRSREAPARVLLKTVQEEPPLFARESSLHKYSKAFKDLVESCLMKDPAKRPTAAELLETPFLKSAKKKSYLVGTILADLPPLAKRQERRMLDSQPSHLRTRNSMSSWDFTIELQHAPVTSHRPHSNQHQHQHHSASARSSMHSAPHQHTQAHHSHNVSLSPAETPLIELEENALAEALAQARLQQLRAASHAEIKARDYVDVENESENENEAAEGVGSSPASSVFELSTTEESSPGSAPSSLPGGAGGASSSSAATTPLSCSPADAQGYIDASASKNGCGGRLGGERGDSGAGAGSVGNATAKPSLRHALTASVGAGPGRRGSSPTATRPSVSAAPTLQRMRSASGDTMPRLKPGAGPGASKWRRMMSRRGSSSAGVGAGAGGVTDSTAGAPSAGESGGGALGVPGQVQAQAQSPTPPMERKKGTLGRFLERSKSGLVGA